MQQIYPFPLFKIKLLLCLGRRAKHCTEILINELAFVTSAYTDNSLTICVIRAVETSPAETN